MNTQDFENELVYAWTKFDFMDALPKFSRQKWQLVFERLGGIYDGLKIAGALSIEVGDDLIFLRELCFSMQKEASNDE